MKNFFKFIALLTVIIVISLFIVRMSLNAIVKAGIETMGTQMVGAPVSLEDVDISLVSDGNQVRGSLIGLVIQNPPKFSTAQALSFPHVRIRANRESVLRDTVMIDEIVIDHPEITFEDSPHGSNLSHIQERIESFSQGTTLNTSSENIKREQLENDSGKYVQVAQVIIKNARVNLHVPALKSELVQLTLSDIVLNNIGTQSGGIRFQEAGFEIFKALLESVNKTITRSKTP